jgi:hypothetical protein
MPKPRNEKAAFRALLADCQAAYLEAREGLPLKVRNPARAAFRIHDGEAWTSPENISDHKRVAALANSTGEDALKVCGPEGAPLATFYLVWGNAPDGSELITDCSGNAFADAVCARFARRFD